MKNLRLNFFLLFFLVLFYFSSFGAVPTAGFFLPDSVNEMTLKYRTAKGLIILPVTINDSVQVNLILDTGCRNLILFGKKFKNLFRMSSAKPIVFSGLGSGRPVTGKLSIGNKVSISEVLGEQIPVVVVETNNLFGNYHNVHGVIGYDIFLKFEIELNAVARTIVFRPALKSMPPRGYTQIPLDIVDARPIIQSQIHLDKYTLGNFDLMIDTGSYLGLLLKTTNISDFDHHRNEKILGIGFNGPVSGYQTISNKLIVAGLEIDSVPTGIVSSEWHNNASIGMQVLKDYIVILNYCKAYACFKRNES
ncbi:MAG TPA: aspartyl protease family protein [Flavitalea sp.]|nr:aspartyl protease family protein [Flavitalea sp.]